MLEIAFDQNNDGMINDEEATFYLSGHESYDQETFVNTGWLLMKQLFSKFENANKNDNIEVIVNYVEENLQLNSSVNNERSASFVIHNINASAVSSELTDLFQSSREKDSDPSCTRFEILYDMLERWAVCGIDSHLSVAHASATYNLVNRLQKSHEGSSAHHPHSHPHAH